MYAIVHVIYGLPLVAEIQEQIVSLEERPESEDDPDEDENWWESSEGPCGFKTFYDGSAQYAPGYCGVELSSFPACGEPFLLSSLIVSPTEKQVEEARDKINALPKWVKKTYKDLDITPSVYVVFSTS